MRKKHDGLFINQQNSLDFVVNKLTKNTYPWIKYAILFGSCATGNNHFGSDLDILIATDGEVQDFKEDMRSIKREFLSLPDTEYAEIDPKFLDVNYIRSENTTFLQNIKREGKIIWTQTHI